MNYHAKSGAYSLKIDWVMLNLVFGGHFFFGKKYCRGSLRTTMQKIE